MRSPPKNLLKSKYRKDLWKNVSKIVREIDKNIPISQIHIMGSFATKKKRPADVDFIVLLKTRKNNKKKWSTDLVIVPDNSHGKKVFEDTKKWVKQKYGSKKAGVIRIK